MSSAKLSRQLLLLPPLRHAAGRRQLGLIKLHNPRPPSLAVCARCIAAQQRRHASTEQERGSFTGQLFDSIGARTKKEKEDMARFAEMRQAKERPGGLGVLFMLAFSGVFGYWVGSYNRLPPAPTSTVPLSEAPALTHDTKKQNMQAAWTDLKNVVGADNISIEQDDLLAHAGSEWSSQPTDPKSLPFAIVKPGSTEDVSRIMKVCHARQIPVTPFSGGTSLEGHFSNPLGGICIDFSRMDSIKELHKEDLDVVVQPAVGWETLNEFLSQDGLFFPPDPGPGAQIGGMIGTGCSGTNAYRYGTMKDWVLSLTVVLADGTVIKTRQRPRKSSAGYDLTRLFVGSEGTLGLVTEATLKVTVKPPQTSVAVCAFPSIRTAADCVSAVVGAGIPVAAIEVLDDVQMKCINEAGSTARRWAEAPTLFFKFAGTPAAVKEQIGIVQKVARSRGGRSFEFARNEEEATELWSARKEALWSVMAKRKDEGEHVWTTDVAVPISRLPDIIEETKGDVARSGLFGSIVGHVGDGNFHAILLYSDRQRKLAEGVVHRMVKRAVEMEGTVTGEHGVGLVKRDYLKHELGESTVDAMRKLKLAYDPLCILNCGKTVRMAKPGKGDEEVEWK